MLIEENRFLIAQHEVKMQEEMKLLFHILPQSFITNRCLTEGTLKVHVL